MSSRAESSPVPILIIIVLAGMSLVQLIAPSLIPPGLTLFLLGAVFLLLYGVNWIRDSVTLISGWILVGFGLTYWASTVEPFVGLGGALLLFGLAFAFFAIYLTMGKDLKIESRKWPLILGALLLSIGLMLVAENLVGRERLWSIVVPLIPAVVAIWYIIEWRRNTRSMEVEGE